MFILCDKIARDKMRSLNPSTTGVFESGHEELAAFFLLERNCAAKIGLSESGHEEVIAFFFRVPI